MSTFFRIERTTEKFGWLDRCGANCSKSDDHDCPEGAIQGGPVRIEKNYRGTVVERCGGRRRLSETATRREYKKKEGADRNDDKERGGKNYEATKTKLMGKGQRSPRDS